MRGYKTEPLVVPEHSGLLPESERNRRVALTSFTLSRPAEVPLREVVCYECGARCEVPQAALSAKCSHCQSHLKMTDVELKPGARRLTVRTLGNVTIQSGAVLSGISIVCRNCYLNGRGSGVIRCSGKLQVSCHNRMEGAVEAGCLEVDRAVDLVLAQGASVDELNVCGRVTGRIVAARKIVIRRGGELYGNCYSPELVVEPGGMHRGEWRQSPQ